MHSSVRIRSTSTAALFALVLFALTSLVAHAAPGAPTNLVKTTPDTDPSPTFTWNAAPDANLARHQVKFDDGAFSSVGLATTFTVGELASDIIKLDSFVVEDGKFELRMGDTSVFGFDAEQRIPTISGLVEIVMGPILVGETVSFGRCRMSASRSTKAHHMTIEALGIDFNLNESPVGVSGNPDDNCVIGPFTAPGEFFIDDSTDPGAHGVAKFVVEDAVLADLSPGTHTIEVRGVDKAGNVGSSASLVFSVTAPPLPGVSGPTLAGLGALLAAAFVWGVRRRQRTAAGR